MFNILIIEDNPEKLRDTLQLLSKIDEIEIDLIDTELDAHSAKKRLKEKVYDLLILDIAIPPRKSEEVDLEGGLKLLNEIQNRNIYKIPTHIIGLTGREEILVKAQKVFEDKMLTVIHYSVSDIEWQTKLLEGIRQRIASKDSLIHCQPDCVFDIAIICALKSELDANKNNGWEWSSFNIPNDDTNYYISEFTKSNGIKVKIIAAKAERMGMPATASLSMKLIDKFRPKYIIMTGIMAGVHGRVSLGDIVIPSPVWDWGSGKWVSVNEEQDNSVRSLFSVDPYQFSVDGQILKEINLMSEDDTFLFNLRKSYGVNAPKTDLKIHVGAVASGASVLSDKTIFDKIKDQHRKLLGVEMEAYGVFSAAEVSSRPKPLALCVKSVVDFGDSEKDDDYQDYGAYISANFVKALIDKLN